MQKQETKNISTSFLPQVRYHPTIQMPDGTPSTTGTRKFHKRKAEAVQPPLNKTDQKNQAVPVCVGTPQTLCAEKLVDKLGQEGDPDSTSDRGAPRPEQVPLGLEVQLDRRVVDEVEVLTRGQRTNPDWFAWRKNRITASLAHSIAHCRFVEGKSKTPPASYLAAVTGEGLRMQTRAMSWGVVNESVAVGRYQTLKSAALRRPVSVQDCGLFIDPQSPWLAASPDGIVTDSKTGQWLVCLEVKCPYKHKDRRVEDACRDDPAFCLKIQDDNGRQPGRPPMYRLKASHSYFTQIQCQLAVTGLRRADLVVFTLKETAIVPVTFEPDLWEETLSKLKVFYRDAILPRLREKTQEM